MIQLDEAPVATWSGDPVVVAGRLPDLDASDELLVSDGTAAALGIDAGSEIWISDVQGNGEPFASTVVGVVRTLGELVPERSDVPLASGSPMFHASGAWSRAHGDDVLRASNSVGVFLDGRDPDQFIDELVDRLPGRLFNATPPVDSELLDTARQATGYESRAGGRRRRGCGVGGSVPGRPGSGPPVPSRVRRPRRAARPRRHPPRPRRVVLVAVGRDGSARRCGQRRRRRRGEHARSDRHRPARSVDPRRHDRPGGAGGGGAGRASPS